MITMTTMLAGKVLQLLPRSFFHIKCGCRFMSGAALKERNVGVIGLGMVGNAVVKNLQRTG